MPSYVVEKVYIDKVSREHIGKIITTKVRIDCIESGYKASRPTIAYGKNGKETVEILFFNYKKYYVKNAFPVGNEVYISGKLSESFSQNLQFINPKKVMAEKIDDNIGLFNIYPLTTGISQNEVYIVLRIALNFLKNGEFEEWLPQSIIERNGFYSFYDSLKNIHFPKGFFYKHLDTAYLKRIVFDELLAEQLIIRLSNPRSKVGNVLENKKLLIKQLMGILDFNLTNSQKKVLSEIFSDLKAGAPMTRLLQGDVGSGKTIVAIITALYAIESGYQCAILAPTEILARQHHKTIKNYLDRLNLSVELLTANEKGSKRKKILEELALGKINILTGTHSIISEKIDFCNLGLVIIDEQHKFGVTQRLQLIEKGISPHVLSMTATPIPRSIIMSLCGDISVSSITEKPSGRKEVITRAVPLDQVGKVIDWIRERTCKGEKIYWVCPLIEESEKLPYNCVVNRFNFLKKYFEDEVEMLHGKMKTIEKQNVFDRFNYENCKILVSTSVIEVGLDVPSASVIVIENAEKFGLAQLHQLRGRVGRGSLQSYCILLFDSKMSQLASKRINILMESSDGFKIAEQDLVLRGGGEILGTKQSGEKVYKTFDVNDPESQLCIFDLMKQAATLATNIVNSGHVSDYETLLKIFRYENFESIKLSF
jgi:ATP-dependent DNA helicase RecG